MKYSNRLINVGENPIIIVGQNPGRQRGGVIDPTCWKNNRSADLLLEAIDGVDNIILTNICQYRDMTKDRIQEGVDDLKTLIDEVKPSKIIFIGELAYQKGINLCFKYYVPSKSFYHPSYINRFGKDREEYKRNLRKELK